MAVTILVLALLNKPAVKWWGLTQILRAFIEIIIYNVMGWDLPLISFLPLLMLATVTIIEVVECLPLLMLATVTIIEVVEWRKAGNVLQWQPPKLYRNPVFLVILAVVIINTIVFGSLFIFS
jgi:hypothetical protein